MGWSSASVNSIEVQTGHSLGETSNLGNPAGHLKCSEFISLTPYRILGSLGVARLEQCNKWFEIQELTADHDPTTRS